MENWSRIPINSRLFELLYAEPLVRWCIGAEGHAPTFGSHYAIIGSLIATNKRVVG